MRCFNMSLSKNTFILYILVSFIIGTTGVSAQEDSLSDLPVPGTMVDSSPAFVPVLPMGMTVYPDNPLLFDLIIDSGHTEFTEGQIKQETTKLIKYFLASLTIPNGDMWVNLSPYEKDRIIPETLGQTELGRDMLAQDYVLKQLSSSLTNPDSPLGRDFWNQVYAKAYELYGTTEIPVSTFNKVWILPDEAVIFQENNTVFLISSRLKVMSDSDYKARQNNPLEEDFSNGTDAEAVNDLSSQILKDIIIPEIDREVNEGENFAVMRQIYQAMLLAKWYKETVKDSVLSHAYVDQYKIIGVETPDKTVKDKIYARYMEAFKKGVFDFIREDYNPFTQEEIPRKYFSGGQNLTGQADFQQGSSAGLGATGQGLRATVGLELQAGAASVILPGAAARYSRFFNDPGLLNQSEGRAVIAELRKRFMMHNGTTIRVMRNKEDFPDDPTVLDAWKNHYAVFEVHNERLGYTAYIAMHDLVQIESDDPRVAGKFMCIGGLRKQHYGDDPEQAKLIALREALGLSEAMTSKNALVIPIGGGKTVVHIHNFDPADKDKQDTPERDAITRDLMRAYAVINFSLGGNGLFVAEDQNMTERDMQVAYEAIDNNPWVLPNSDPTHNKHPSRYTTLGVIKSMKRAIFFAPGIEIEDQEKPLKDKVVAVMGVGNIGAETVEKLLSKEEAIVIASDIEDEAINDLLMMPGISEAIEQKRLFVFKDDGPGPGNIFNPFNKYGAVLEDMGVTLINIFSPNGKAEIINNVTIPLLKEAGVTVIAGATNNVLTRGKELELAELLNKEGFVYGVDWVVNSSGVQAVAGTRTFASGQERSHNIEIITDNTAATIQEVLTKWDQAGRGESILAIANKLVEENRAKLTHAPQPKDKVGGIDMNGLDFEKWGTASNITFDPQVMQQILAQDLTGFNFSIINIVPLEGFNF